MNSSVFRDGDIPYAAQTLLSGLTQSVVPQDTVQYWIYPGSSSSSQPDCLSLEDLLSCAFELSKDYIWHNEGFRLQFKSLPTPHFFGSTLFDENLEDEWFVVFLLVELSKKFSDIVIKVNDSDGELLLIEAAEFLPDWLNPEVAENRVFIHNGTVHIIPPHESSQYPANSGVKSTETKFPVRITDAKVGATFVAENPETTRASPAILDAVAQRLRTFSEGRGAANWHRANCLLLPKVAMILKNKPKLVAEAVRAFYLKDAFDIKACREMKHFKPVSNADELVLSSVRFSKHLYAMIRGQKFTPDRRSGWLQLLNAICGDGEAPERRKAFDIGMKLCCGFEILCNRAETSRRLKKASHALSPIYEFADSDTRWQAFAASLKKNGYFRGELEGSKLHNELVMQAKSFFESALLNEESPGIDPGVELIRLGEVQVSKAELDAIKAEEICLPAENDDSWLEVTAGDLDSTIPGCSPPNSNGFGGLEDADDELEEAEENYQSGSGASKSPMKQKQRKKSRDRVAASSSAGGAVADARAMGAKLIDWVERGSGPAAEGAEEPKLVTPKKSRSKMGGSTGNDPCARSLQRMIDLNLENHGLEGADEESSGMDSYDEDELKIDLSEIGATKQMKEWGMSLRDYMKTMDKELAGTTMGKSFKNVSRPPPRAKSKSPAADSIDLEDDEFRPVNIDKNLVTNMLESYWSESQPGPATALLRTLKLRPPRDRGELDSDDFEEEFAGEDDGK